MMELTESDVSALLPRRKAEAHKGDFGKLLLLCGSVGFTGAPFFAAMGALRSGAGLVYLGVPRSIYAIEAVKLNEPVIFPLPETGGMLSMDALPQILQRLPKMDAVLIGPGLGIRESTFALLEAVLRQARCPVVVDADGITLLAGHMDILRGRASPTILTPHDGEFARLFGPAGTDRMAACREAAKASNSIVLLKGHRTCISDGTRDYRNLTGNPGMAVGGSGDVLAGILTSLLGQGLAPLEAAACAAWLHGAAGDLCARELGQYGMLPSDLVSALPQLLIKAGCN